MQVIKSLPLIDNEHTTLHFVWLFLSLSIFTHFLIYLLPLELGVTVNGQHRSRRDNWSSTGATSTDSTTKIKLKQPGWQLLHAIFTYHLWLIVLLLLWLGLELSWRSKSLPMQTKI